MQPENGFKWISLFYLISTVSTLIVDDSEKDELEAIERSRKIIRHIEDCRLNQPYASSSQPNSRYEDKESNSFDELEDAGCGESKYLDVTKSIANNVKDEKLPRDAMLIAYNAVLEKNSFADIATYIENEIKKNKPGQQWLTVVNSDTKVEDRTLENRALERRFSEYLDFLVAKIRIKIYNLGPIKTNGTDESSDSSRNISLSSTHSIDKNSMKTLIETTSLSLKLNFQQNLIHVSASHNLLPFVQFLVEEKNVDPGLKDDLTGRSPACFASMNNSLEVLEFLIEKRNIDYHVRDNDGNGLLHCATLGTENLNVLRYLIKKRLDSNSRNNFGDTPLHVAVASNNGFLPTIRYLVESAKADLQAKNANLKTPLDLATEFKHLDVMKYLVSKGAVLSQAIQVQKVDNYQHKSTATTTTTTTTTMKPEEPRAKSSTKRLRDDFQIVPFFTKALENDDLESLKLVFGTRNVSPDYKFENEKSFLHLATESNRFAFVQFLIEKGLDPNQKDKQGLTPMHIASKKSLNLLKYLVSHGGDVNVVDENGEALIHYCQSGEKMEKNVETMKYLVEEKNVDDKLGNTYNYQPIHYSSFYGCLPCAKWLIKDRKVDVNAKSRYSYTPLREAVKYHRKDIMKFLVENGADINQKDWKGKSALKIAQERDNKEAIEYLEQQLNSTSQQSSSVDKNHNKSDSVPQIIAHLKNYTL